MTTQCSLYQESFITNAVRTVFFEDDFLTGTTFLKHNKVKNHKNPFVFTGRVSYGSGEVIIDLGNLYNYFMHIPIYTRFKLKDEAIVKPIHSSLSIVSEPEEKEFSFKPFPVRKYELKVKIASIRKGVHKFQPFNDYR